MNDLLKNMNRVHTTPRGKVRIVKNTGQQIVDISSWFINQITEAKKIQKIGKNWYVFNDEIMLTINASRYTVITAHANKKAPK